MAIKDSGNRTIFETGAVRDMREGKGRCDLMPLDVIGEYMKDTVLNNINSFMGSKNPEYLWDAITVFSLEVEKPFKGITSPKQNIANVMLEVSKHFEGGADKYGIDNWKKGIPVYSYIDSAVRHYLKFLRGDKDEPHDRAFIWNLLCCLWTWKHKPELRDNENANF